MPSPLQWTDGKSCYRATAAPSFQNFGELNVAELNKAQIWDLMGKKETEQPGAFV